MMLLVGICIGFIAGGALTLLYAIASIGCVDE